MSEFKMRRFFTFAVSAVALFLLLATFVGLAGSFFWIFDICNNFRVQFLVASFVGLGLSLILRSRILLGSYAMILVVNLSFIAPLYVAPSDHSEVDASSREVSVVSYNAWLRNDDWESIKSVLEAENPSIIYLTELHPDIETRIKSLQNVFHIFRKKSDAILVRRDAMLNPRLVVNAEVDALPGIVVSMKFEKVELMFLGIHPAAPLSGEATRRRDESFDAVASIVEEADELVIVAGDFNATSWSSPFRRLQKRTGLVNSQRGEGIQATWPSYPGSYFNGLLRIPIDHCLHSPEIMTLNRAVGDAGKSNHNPIRVDLIIPVSR